MGQELHFLDKQPKIQRDYAARAREKTPQVIEIAKKFGKEFFDGDRLYGYGGYFYDGRWVKVARRLIEHYKLADNARILDIGCAKGFLMHDFQTLLPHAEIFGVEISKYAIESALPTVRQKIVQCSAEKLPFEDQYFDFVVSINSIHNLPKTLLIQALKEIERVSKGKSYLTVDAWRSKQEEENLMQWILTAETALHTKDWIQLFSQAGYSGDYSWFIAE